jgi:hypothetical protein
VTYERVGMGWHSRRTVGCRVGCAPSVGVSNKAIANQIVAAIGDRLDKRWTTALTPT